ncbi:MAG: TonB-dependent receptor [Marinobacterium sp.]|nr:TonB-dependent receptor [Marinobacterium sp.]
MKLTTVTSLSLLTLAIQAANAQSNTLDTLVVTGDFREAQLQDTPASISVLDADTLNARGAGHLEEVLALTPNVNFSGGTNRARFYQIRGIGERSQFVEPLNPSVGLLVDGIDMSGLGDAASLLDIDQVEVFRGPQGTLSGANALAGLISMRSAEPTDRYEGQLETTLADYNTRSVQAVVSGPVSESVGYRLAIKKLGSDGFSQNDHLGRKDTDGRDELTLRGKLRIDASDDLTLNLTALHINNNNGYDAFSLDNNRHTLADQPGHDHNNTSALALAADYSGYDSFELQTRLSVSRSDTEYGYDEDWTFDGFHPDGYSSADNYIRDRRNASADIRLVSAPGAGLFNGASDWVLGGYAFRQSVDLTREYTYLSNNFTSQFDADRLALYGQLDTALAARWTLITGLRVERWDADYQDSEGVDSSPAETLWGGRVALEYSLDDNSLLYGLVSRGYKAGGFNSNGTLPAELRQFDTETLWNYELGLKGSWLNDRLTGQLAFFYQQRDDVQIKASRQVVRSDGSREFIDYIDNSAKGHNYGVELEGRYQATEQLTLSAATGLLYTELEEAGANYNNRDQAQAPNYQLTLAADYGFAAGWYSRLELEAKDEFYLSDRHNAETESYTLFNARIGYQQDNWELSLWAKNLTDEDYITRGFGSFGNDPRNGYTTEPYYIFGAPRQIGVTAKLDF